MTPEEFFAGDEVARRIYDAVCRAVEPLGDPHIRVSKSQIAFRRRHTFAAVWRHGRYLSGRTAPLVLTVFLPFRDASPRWKEVVEPAPARYTHHLELWRSRDIDDEVLAWLRQAWDAAA